MEITLSRALGFRPLPNPRHELFARSYALSGNAAASHRSAGFKGANSDVMGARLAKNPVFLARVEHLRAEAKAENAFGRTDLLLWLGKVVRGEVSADPTQLAAADLLVRVAGLGK